MFIPEDYYITNHEISTCLTPPLLGHVAQQEVVDVVSEMLPPGLVPADLTGLSSENRELEESFYGNMDANSPLPWLADFDFSADPLTYNPNV
jgi:hypothetical protein